MTFTLEPTYTFGLTLRPMDGGTTPYTGPDFFLEIAPFYMGAPGPSGAAGAKYLHTQASPSATWTVNHNLGVRPIIAVFSIGWVEVGANTTHTNENQAIIYFNTANAGFAVCQ